MRNGTHPDRSSSLVSGVAQFELAALAEPAPLAVSRAVGDGYRVDRQPPKFVRASSNQ
jgi:hypothetical protein